MLANNKTRHVQMVSSIVLVLLILALINILTGCATTGVRLPNIQEEKSVLLKEKTIVLLRLKVEKDGEPFNPFNKLIAGSGHMYFRLKLANMDEGEYPEYITLDYSQYNIQAASPSLESKKEGWMYLVLNPGTYYLSFFPPGSKEPSSFDVSPQVSAFRFYVPEGESIMYVGSMSVSCEWSRGIIRNFIGESSEIVVTDETESAKKIAQASLIKYGQMSTSLMQQYDKLVTSFTIDKHVPIGVMTRDTKIFTAPDLMWRAIDQGLAPTSIMCDIQSTIGMFFTLPPGLVFGTIKGFADKDRYQSFMQELELKASKLDTAEIFRQTLRNRLPKYGISQLVELEGDDNIYENIPKNGFKSILLAKILRIELIEDKDWGKKFYVEVAIRVKLKEVATNTCIYDRVLLYTNPHRILSYYKNRTYELPLYETSECRELEIYCEQEGFKILKEEITNAIQFSVERFCQDLGLKP